MAPRLTRFIGRGRTLRAPDTTSRKKEDGDEPTNRPWVRKILDRVAAQGTPTDDDEFVQRLMQAAKEELGPEDPRTLAFMAKLAIRLYEAGQYARAREFSKMCQALGPEHPSTLTAMNNLHAQGDLSAARKLLEQVVVSRRLVLGAEHPDTLPSALNYH